MALTYPTVQGVRMDPSSVEMKLLAPVDLIILFVSVNWKRSRSRTKLELNHPDPVGKTRGKNAYDADFELAIAEFMAIIAKLGPGYGDIPFDISLNITENGFDPVNVMIYNCTLDEDDGGASGSDPLKRKTALSPTKIKVNGLDDLSIPLPQFAAVAT